MKKANIWKNSILLKAVAVVVFIIAAGIITVNIGSGGKTQSSDYILSDNLSDKAQESFAESNDADKISVYICGCVNEPGVYECKSTDRVADIIELAKGMTDDADMNGINLAKYVSDAEKIYIGAKVDTAHAGKEESGINEEDIYVNINTADEEKLTALPGIGETRAKAIIEYRTKNGMFNEIEDIKNVSGIKEALFEKIKELIRV